MAIDPARAVFLDTSGLIALISGDDFHHAPAIARFDAVLRRFDPIVTTNLVIAETANSLAKTAIRASVFPFVRGLASFPSFELVFVDQKLFAQAVARYETVMDKNWGLVDCASFVLMDGRGITRAFTADRHFSQAGFECLLGDSAGGA